MHLDGTDGHEVSHHCLGGHEAELNVPLLLSSHVQMDLLLLPVGQLEALAVGKFTGGNFVVEDTNILVLSIIIDQITAQILLRVDLMTKRDAPEKFDYAFFVFVPGLLLVQDVFHLSIIKPLAELNFVRKVIKTIFALALVVVVVLAL